MNLVPRLEIIPDRNAHAIQRAKEGQAAYIPHLGLEEVKLLALAASEGRHGIRNSLLIETIFDGAFRVSEVVPADEEYEYCTFCNSKSPCEYPDHKGIGETRNTTTHGLRPVDLIQSLEGWTARILGKGNKYGEAALSASLVAKLHQYAYQIGLPRTAPFFQISRARVWQIVNAAFDKAGIQKPDNVGTVHVLRHSGAIARLQSTGNAKAVQDQLRHSSASMTLKYLKTLTAKESIRIQQEVDFRW